MRKLARLGLIAVLLLACVGCDQVSKEMVRGHVALGHSESFLGDTLRLTHVENSGAFLSIGASLSQPARVAVFQVGVALLLVGLLWYALFARQLDVWSVAGVSLLIASGLGNLIDRFLQEGRVTDFLNLGVGALRTGIFNVADVVGVIGFALLVFRGLPVSPASGDLSRKYR
jgi:signal peptidase II